MSQKEYGSFQLIGALGLAGLLSGLLLVGVYLWTQPMILENRAQALQAAVLRVVPGATKIQAHERVDGKLRPYTGPAGTPGAHPMAYAGLAGDGRVIGYAMPAEGAGFMDTIKLLYGYDPKAQRIIGMEVLESRETPGLGDKILFDEHFLANFKALVVQPEIVAVKLGEKTQDNQVDCITGATISSKAVVKILNASAQEWVGPLGAQAQAAPAAAASTP